MLIKKQNKNKGILDIIGYVIGNSISKLEISFWPNKIIKTRRKNPRDCVMIIVYGKNYLAIEHV